MARYYGNSDYQFMLRMSYVVKRLIIANVAVFFLQGICQLAFRVDYLSVFLGLNSFLVLKGMIWQPATYMFLHANPWHLFWNMFALWMFGSAVEEAWGPRAFLQYYLFTGTAAGLLSFVTSIGVNVVTIGASGAIFGLLVAFGMLFPNRIILAFFIFPMRAKHFVMVFAALELWMTLSAGQPGGEVARFAHIGGMLFGYLYLKYGDKFKYALPRIKLTVRSRGEKREKEWMGFVENEVDPILDKISREGIHSLTRKEKRILKKARGRRGNGV